MDLLLQQNLTNLHTFWSAMPHQKVHGHCIHQCWPNKAWREDFTLPTDNILKDKTWVTTDTSNLQSDYRIKIALLAMALKLDQVQGQLSDQIEIIVGTEQLATWVHACSQAFGYNIDESSVSYLMADPNVTLFAYNVTQGIAGTAIAYQTQNTMGVHQMGIRDTYRGLGIARKLMMQLVEFAKQKGCDLMTLQASEAGRPLYNKMGFNALTEVYHLQRGA